MNADWIDVVAAAAEVVAAVAAAAAAIFAWKAIRRVEDARESDRREGLVAAVQRTLLQLKFYSPNDSSRARDIDVLRRQLEIEHEALMPIDREQLPSIREIVESRAISPAKVDQALREVAILRGGKH